MAAVTVVKTIGSTGTFSTPQLWEDGAPANLTTAEQSAAGTFAVASFTQGESLTFVGSGATGKFLHTDSTGVGTGTYVTYGITTGNPAASDVVTGGSSGATCILSSGTADFVGVVWQGRCQNQEFSSATTVLTIGGSTMSSTTYKEITTVPGASFRDHANVQTNPLRYNASNGCGFRTTGAETQTVLLNNESYNRVSKLQIVGTGLSAQAMINESPNHLVEYCLFEGTYDGTDATLGVLGGNDGGVTRNCVVIQRGDVANHIVGTGSVFSPEFYN